MCGRFGAATPKDVHQTGHGVHTNLSASAFSVPLRGKFFFFAGRERILVDLIEAGLQSKEAEKERFFALANRLTESADPTERQRLKDELARMTFGE